SKEAMSNKLDEAIQEWNSEFEGKQLSTDEYARASNSLKKAINALESIELQSGDDYIGLKWGTLKAWSLHSEKGKRLLERYGEIGVSYSAMDQQDIPGQKHLICQIIDECDGPIYSDWDGEGFTKQEAKDYVMGYGVKQEDI